MTHHRPLAIVAVLLSTVASPLLLSVDAASAAEAAASPAPAPPAASPEAASADRLAASATGTPGRAEELRDRILAYARPLEESGFLSGCLAVWRDGEPPVRACFGHADAARKVPNEPGTRFCIASLSKPITAVAVMRLVDQKKLGLDDPVSRWIEGFPSGDSIAVRDLLTHAAGVPHRVTTPEEETQRFTPAEIVARIEERDLLFPPGTRAQYSSAGYTVLARIVELATGKDFGDALASLVLEPLGMRDTFHPDGRPIARRATSFVAGADGPTEAPAKDYAFLAGAGSLYATCDDVLRFARACLDHDLLSEAAWEGFHSLGWAAGDEVRWSGSTNGFGAWVDMRKPERSVFVYLGNAGTGAAGILRAALPGLVAGEQVEPAPRAPARVALTVAQLQGLEGGYSRGQGSPTLQVTVQDGVLRMGDNIVYPVDVDRFFNPIYFSLSTFERGEDGAATSISMTAPGLSAPLVFRRVE